MKCSLVAIRVAYLSLAFSVSACTMSQGLDPFSNNPYGIPNEKMPPPGLCRIWYPNRPSRNQPPIGDCDYLQARLPSDAQLIRGDGRASIGQSGGAFSSGSTSTTTSNPGNGLPPANSSNIPPTGGAPVTGTNDQFGVPDPQAEMQRRRQEDLNRRY